MTLVMVMVVTDGGDDGDIIGGNDVDGDIGGDRWC